MTEPPLPEESIFAQALEITSAADRAAFLDRACGQNQTLRADVEALLRAHERAGDALDLPESASVTTDQPARAGRVPVIGPYKLLEIIGEGGMGTVWMAEQTDPIQRRVAVKVIKDGMDSRQVLSRFEAERQALALMEHPHIAKVLDAGKTPTGRPYFVMELVKGRPITSYCDEKRLGVRERLVLFGDVCRAVQHAHQKGVIHRDLKPSNVLVAPYDGKPVVKVIDFGVAKATGQRLTDKTLFTGFGALVGTPEYMSPEQAEVNNQDIDTRSDIYSLGVLLYELLTGSTPLTRKRLKEVVLLEVLRAIREEEPPRPSTRLIESKDSLPSISEQRQTEPAKLTKLVRGELDWIVMKALEKDRNRRYETANGFAMDIQRYLADEAVQACPPSAAYRLRKIIRRNKVGFGTAALIAGVLILATVVSISQAVRARKAEDIAQNDRSKAESLARTEADANSRAQEQTKLATKRAEELSRQDYVSRVNLAYRECLDNNVSRALELLDGCPNDLRGWEWDYAWRQCHFELGTFLQSGVTLNGVAFSPDGTRIASVSGAYGGDEPALKGDLVVRDVATRQEIFSHRDVASGFRGVAFSPDGRWIATGNASDVVIWNAATGKEEFRLPDPGRRDSSVLSLAFSPDSQRIIASYGAFNNSTVVGHANLWDLTSRNIKRVPVNHGTVFSVAFSPDGREVAVSSGGIVDVWDVEGPIRQIRSLRGHLPASVYAVAFSSDGLYLASGGTDRTIRLWDRATGQEIRALYGHKGFVRGLAFSRDSQWLVSASDDSSLKLWEVASGRSLADFHGHQSFASCVAFSPDGWLIASGGQDRAVKLWSATRRAPLTFTGHDPDGGAVFGLVFLPKSQRLVSGASWLTTRGQLKLWDATTGEPLEPSFESCPGIQAVALHRDGRRLATAQLDRIAGVGTVRVWDLETGQRVWENEAHAAWAMDVAYSPDGRWLASAGADERELGGEVRLWDAETGREIRNFGRRTAGVHGVAFSPDGRWLASGWGDGIVRLWDVKEPAGAARELPGHAGGVQRVVFLPDGRLASAGGRYPGAGTSDFGEVKIWDLSTRRVLNLRGHTGIVEGLACSPDGRRLLTGSNDRTIKLWDTTTGEEVFTLRGHAAGVLCVAFSPDGRRIASGGFDRTVRVWDTTAPASHAMFRQSAESRVPPEALPADPFAR